MARSSKAGGKRIAAKTRKSRSAKARPPAKRPGLSAGQLKHSKNSDVELRQAREQQAATVNILKVISQSTFDLQAVLAALVKSAVHLCDADTGIIRRREEDMYPVAATFGLTEQESHHFAQYSSKPDEGSVFGRAILEKRAIHVPDLLADRRIDRDRLKDYAKDVKIRSGLGVPLLRDGIPIGVFTLQRRQRRPFTKSQIELVEAFAHQAVIAIENTRLFNEVQARTRDLGDSLQQQTATADVLKVISRSTFDVQTVLDTLVESATRLCEADHAYLFQRDGDLLLFKSSFGQDTAIHEALRKLLLRRELPINRESIVGRSASEGRLVHVADVLKDPEYVWNESQEISGFRAAIGAPLLRDSQVLGVIFIGKAKPGQFSEKQIELVATFADQAVIAIENTRLFNETREALERQTATADILKVIAGSPTDIQPVFEAIAERSHRLLSGHSTAVWQFADDNANLVAFTSTDPIGDTFLRTVSPMRVDRFPWIESIRRCESVHIVDTEALTSSEAAVTFRDIARARGYRSQLLAPLVSQGGAIGYISVTRREPSAFAPHHVDLLRTFADQAVIAIGNVRLFEEVQAKTHDLEESLQQQTATSDLLQVISRSAFDLQPIFDAIVERAVKLCGASRAFIYRFDGELLRMVASHNTPEEFKTWIAQHPIAPGRDSASGRAALERRTIHIHDVRVDPEYTFGAKDVEAVRTNLGVPIVKGDELLGVMLIYHLDEVQPFTEKQIALVETFADQAAIAISNVGLFNEVQRRTRELSQSLDDLRAAQDRLVQTEKLASLGQLTAGIAHEIKNPLNFVNNFSGMSAELIGELQEIVTGLSVDPDTHAGIKELTDMLGANLEKIVHHGKRADAIVKSMLLHSGQSSSEHRLTDMNALVDESLNRAYYGERAETRGFAITLEKSFDPTIGDVDLFPREISRAVLNLISNAFYATSKRRETEGSDYEPVLVAATRNLGETVEIRIRDNGTGIPPDVREKMFNPFFTTKPTGEGTGLGLSMTHDIVVKQHGGRIDVETEPGAFTEFIISLPRGSGTTTGSQPK